MDEGFYDNNTWKRGVDAGKQHGGICDESDGVRFYEVDTSFCHLSDDVHGSAADRSYYFWSDT